MLSKSTSLENKKKYIIQNKNKVLLLIPTLLSAVLQSIGTQFVLSNGNSIQKICNDKSIGARTTKGEEDTGL